MQAGGAVTVDSEWTQREDATQADGGGGIWKPSSAGAAKQEKATRSVGVATCKPLRRGHPSASEPN